MCMEETTERRQINRVSASASASAAACACVWQLFSLYTRRAGPAGVHRKLHVSMPFAMPDFRLAPLLHPYAVCLYIQLGRQWSRVGSFSGALNTRSKRMNRVYCFCARVCHRLRDACLIMHMAMDWLGLTAPSIRHPFHAMHVAGLRVTHSRLYPTIALLLVGYCYCAQADKPRQGCLIYAPFSLDAFPSQSPSFVWLLNCFVCCAMCLGCHLDVAWA